MYLRYSTRKKDGKTHRYWRLVQSVRVGRRVIQQTVAQLGELDAEGRLQARALARRLIGTPEPLCSAIWRYASADRRADRDISADLKGSLATAVTTNHAVLTEPKRVGELLRAFDNYVGQPATRYALKFALLTFVRPGELRKSEWDEFDLDGSEPLWRIPAAKMEMRDAHFVPLSAQAVAIVHALKAHTGGGKYLFPSLRSGARPMSENTINAGLRRLGYAHDEQTGHGFRTIASTLLNELGWNTDLIELQLAHKERNKCRASYNKAANRRAAANDASVGGPPGRAAFRR